MIVINIVVCCYRKKATPSQGTPTSSQTNTTTANAEETPEGSKRPTKAKSTKKQKSGETVDLQVLNVCFDLLYSHNN